MAVSRIARHTVAHSSPAEVRYNCIAWAAGVSSIWWWPVFDPVQETCTWPANAPRELTLPAFVAAFATLGYVPCEDETLEPDVERVAQFAGADSMPTHAARQTSDGNWTSKLGKKEDIEHPLRAIEGDVYGTVVQILKRPRSA